MLATEATVQSHAYADAIAAMGSNAEVIERACPLFVSLAEEGWANSDVARAVAQDYLSEFKKTPIAALVLGCTHYPILRDIISETVGPHVKLIDSGAATAHDVETLLDCMDGILLSGGSDLDPRRYGDETRHLTTYGIDAERDGF